MVTESNSGRARLQLRLWPGLWFSCWTAHFLRGLESPKADEKKSHREIPCWLSGTPPLHQGLTYQTQRLLCGFIECFVFILLTIQK